MKHLCQIFVLFITIVSCTGKSQPSDPVPPHDTLLIDSKILGETRMINIWTPADYFNQTDSLPVLYMADGGLKEDFPHIANTISALIVARKIPPIILIGIENTQRRRDLTGPTTVEKDKEIAPEVGGSEKFRSFISNELIPQIESKYRTTSEKGIIGESLAGLFVVETLMLTPNLFDFYIAFDPSLWWNDKRLVKSASGHLSKMAPEKKKRFWVASSKAEDIYAVTKDLSGQIKAQNLSNLIHLYTHEPEEEHHTIFRATKEKALIWTLNK